MKALGNNYNFSDFKTRKTFLEAIADDCERMTGSCVSTRASELACSEIKPQTSPTQTPATEAENSSDKETKGKKK